MEMDDDANYISVNRQLWNAKTVYHVDSPYYKVRQFLDDKTFHVLQQTEVDLLGDIHQKRVLHLQCHFGMDTLSLARIGAQHVTGVDLSDVAIDKARELAKEANLDHIVQFFCCDIYELEQHLSVEEKNLFDIVFTSYGTTKWFPDLNKWGKLIERYLKVNGSFIIVDFHPMYWTFDNRYEHIATYSYFNQSPSKLIILKKSTDVALILSVVEHSKGTYADLDAPIQNKSIRWNHSLADIVTALLKNMLRIDVFKEFDSMPFDDLNLSKSSSDGQYRLTKFEGKLPLTYAIKATKYVV